MDSVKTSQGSCSLTKKKKNWLNPQRKRTAKLDIEKLQYWIFFFINRKQIKKLLAYFCFFKHSKEAAEDIKVGKQLERWPQSRGRNWLALRNKNTQALSLNYPEKIHTVYAYIKTILKFYQFRAHTKDFILLVNKLGKFKHSKG